MENKNKQIKVSIVKKEYFNIQYEKNLKKNICINEDLADLVFKWSLETVKQFSKNLIENNSLNFFLCKESDLENIIVKKEKINKMIKKINKSNIQKIDVFELLSILPFLVEKNYKVALNSCLKIFCLEYGDSIITANEFGLFLDSFFRMIVNVLIIEEQIVEDYYLHVIKLDHEEIENQLNLIFHKNKEEELSVNIVLEYLLKILKKFLLY